MIAADRSSTLIVEVQGLTRTFGQRRVLADLSLEIPRGVVYGLLGVNGAGKTTLLKHLLGLYRPEAGSVRVFGLDPIRSPERVLARVGYLAEENDLPGWMTVTELLAFARAIYPTWDDAYAGRLCTDFELDTRAKIRNLSKGQKARAGLVAALAYRPELLLLDEPSSGLDPVVRRDILRAIVRTIADEGRSVLFSSHLLDEVERAADSVALLHQGQLRFDAPLDAVKAEHRLLTIRFHAPCERPPVWPGAVAWWGQQRDWTALVRGPADDAGRVIAEGQIVEERVPSLDEIFLAHVGTNSPTSSLVSAG
jgi:ABC-2 type transport system ATP-binding protein